MKPLPILLFVSTLISASPLMAQNLSELDTVAHYSMINTAVDEQGKYSDIELLNTPFEGTEGVYCNGIYINGFNPNGSLVHTPPIDELFDSTFAISVEFKVDSIPSGISPIFVCGDAYRYLGMMIRWDSIAMYMINNFQYTIPTAPITTHEWHRAVAIYTLADSSATYWLDGQHVATAWGALDRSANDKNVSNTDFGLAFTFEGHLRNLTVLSSGGILSKTTSPKEKNAGRLYPNPTSDILTIEDIRFTSWTIFDMGGKVIDAGKSTQDQQIDVSKLPEGTYSIGLRDQRGMIISRHQFLKI